jgi:ABC-type multidrug transport system ATPase subunit
MRRFVSFVWQEDLFFPSSSYTVRDQLHYTALVRLPGNAESVQLVEAVERVLKVMHLQHCADTSLMCISGGERRRTSIATELICNPKVLLIDEGTSGLDSAAAFHLLRHLRDLAGTEQIPVIASIHQPSARAFHLFDSILVLSEGCCIYHGAPSGCYSYLSSLGYSPHQPDDNPADFLMDLLYSQEASAVTGTWPRYTLIAAWREHERRMAHVTTTESSHAGVGTAIAGLLSSASVGGSTASDAAPGVAAAAPTSSSSSDPDSPSAKLLRPVPFAAVVVVEMRRLGSDPSVSEAEVSSRTDADLECGYGGSSLLTELSDGRTSFRAAPAVDRNALAAKARAAPSSYHRQLNAVAARSFLAAVAIQFGAINVIQTLCMAALVGLCWYQIPLQEDRVGDLSGYVFFLVAYWFFAGMYEGMLEFLPERAVIRRELQSGDYALSACFLGKTAAGCLGRVVLPWLFVTITYFMVAVQPDARTYLHLSGAVVLSTQAGNSIGVLLGTLTTDYHVATSLTAVVSLGMMIVGGFYLKEIPHWLRFLGSLSAFRFAYRACIQVLFADVRSINCMGGYWLHACSAVPYGTVSGTDAVDAIIGTEVDSLGVNIAVLVLFLVIFRVLAYYSLLYSEFYSIYARKT